MTVMQSVAIGDMLRAEIIALANPAGQVYWILYMDTRYSTFSGDAGQLVGNVRGESVRIADGIADNETMARQAIYQTGSELLQHGIRLLDMFAEDSGHAEWAQVPF